MNRERARRREEIAARIFAAICVDTRFTLEAMASESVASAELLMAKLDEAALADAPDADPMRQLAELQDLQAAKEAAVERSVAKTVLIWQKDRQIADLEEQLAALKQRAEGGDDRDIVIEANAIQIAALNGIVKAREDQIAELERKLDSSVKRRNELMDYGRDKDEKLDTMTRFVELVRAEASKSPELYAPFVALLRDLDAKVGAK